MTLKSIVGLNFFSALEASRDYIHVQMTAKPRPYVHFISQTETILQAVSSIQTNNGAKITCLRDLTDALNLQKSVSWGTVNMT